METDGLPVFEPLRPGEQPGRFRTCKVGGRRVISAKSKRRDCSRLVSAE